MNNTLSAGVSPLPEIFVGKAVKYGDLICFVAAMPVDDMVQLVRRRNFSADDIKYDRINSLTVPVAAINRAVDLELLLKLGVVFQFHECFYYRYALTMEIKTEQNLADSLITNQIGYAAAVITQEEFAAAVHRLFPEGVN